MLATLVEEVELKRCPVAKGLYTFCATYRFVASVYLQADILPHLARLSKVFQQANVNFLHIKEQVCYDPSVKHSSFKTSKLKLKSLKFLKS